LANAIVDAAVEEVTFDGNRDPKVIGLALLCRSISNFKGALAMARNNQAVECRTLIRCCFENTFAVGKLCEQGADFVKELGRHEAASRILVGESVLKRLHTAESESGQTIRGHIKGLRQEFPSPTRLSVSDMAKGVAEGLYPSYALLSHDAAHVTIISLSRHFDRDDPRTLDVVPCFKSKERLATVDLACEALLGACIGVNQLMGGTSQGDAVRALFERFERQGRHAAAER
jgi:hypothetical protein